jgi:hypothetical protein
MNEFFSWVAWGNRRFGCFKRGAGCVKALKNMLNY